MKRPISDNIIPMENRTISLSAVIVLMDGFYNGESIVIGNTEMNFKEGVNPLKKTDALYAAVNLTPRTYQATIRAQYYCTKQTTIEIPASDNASPEKQLLKIPITLDPSPAYPFPEKTTLLRGSVLDADTGLPIGNGQVTITYGEVRKTMSANSFGQFVFSFKEASDGLTDASVSVTALGYLPGSANVRIKPDETTMFSIRMNRITIWERETVNSDQIER
jgi:hypothetical protein